MVNGIIIIDNLSRDVLRIRLHAQEQLRHIFLIPVSQHVAQPGAAAQAHGKQY